MIQAEIVRRTLALYRAMKAADNTRPEVGPTARTLGIRPDVDIPVDLAGLVHTGAGGMSVALANPYQLPLFRRPREFGGVGPDPVWCIDETDLGPDLIYVPDPHGPTRHGFIEPARTMSLDTYEAALAGTVPAWTLLQ